MAVDNIMPTNEGDPKQVADDIIDKLNTLSNKKTIAADSHPVTSQYTQYASVASNTISVACPSSEAPAALFGGTWSKLWSTEASYFRTEGDPDASEGQDANRTAGSEPDRTQAWQLGADHDDAGAKDYWADLNAGNYINSGTSYATWGLMRAKTLLQGDSNMLKAMDDGTHGTPRTGYTGQVKNRLMIIWYRTA